MRSRTEKPEKSEAASPIEKRMAYVERVLKQIVARLEKQWGADINDNDQIGGYVRPLLAMAVALLSVWAVASFAATIVSYVDSDASQTEVWKIAGDGDGTATVTLTGAMTASETIAASGFSTTATTLSISNGQEIAAASGIVFLDPTSAIVTATVANASSGMSLHLINVAGGSTNIFFDDAANLKLSSDANVNQYDTLWLIGYDTNWVEAGQVNN